MLSVKARKAADSVFLSPWNDPTENQTQSTSLTANALTTRPRSWL